MKPVINSFQGSLRFLSNFYASPVTYDGMTYPTAEHAYQATKTNEPAEKLTIMGAATPGQAKRLGRKVTLRPDWDAVKLEIMENVLRAKFSTPHLMMWLKRYGENAELIEGNTWGDTYWGVCNGVGHNHLGKLLMKIRDEKHGAET